MNGGRLFLGGGGGEDSKEKWSRSNAQRNPKLFNIIIAKLKEHFEKTLVPEILSRNLKLLRGWMRHYSGLKLFFLLTIRIGREGLHLQ